MPINNHIALRGAWVAQSFQQLTLDFSSGHDPKVVGSSPTLGSTLSREDSLCLSLCPSLPCSCVLSLKKQKTKQKTYCIAFIEHPLYAKGIYIIFLVSQEGASLHFTKV